MAEEHLSLSRYRSPFGGFTLLSSKRGLCYLALPGQEGGVRPWVSRTFGNRAIVVEVGGQEEAIEELDAYFNGRLKHFKVKLDLKGTTFQKTVWRVLMEIPYGETRSYGEIARAIKKPKAFRAVGRANATNPVPIIVPCHRVIQADGSLCGFGGGLDMKRRLLEKEGCVIGGFRSQLSERILSSTSSDGKEVS